VAKEKGEKKGAHEAIVMTLAGADLAELMDKGRVLVKGVGKGPSVQVMLSEPDMDEHEDYQELLELVEELIEDLEAEERESATTGEGEAEEDEEEDDEDELDEDEDAEEDEVPAKKEA
jgi:Cft2 family RNA processing exonuclease